MDAAFQKLLESSEEGRAFTQAVANGQDSHSAWEAFVAQLAGANFDELKAAAGSDKEALKALEALKAYADYEPKLNDGSLTQYDDMAAAQDAIEAGQSPTPNADYEQAMKAVTDAHEELTICLPHWPVLF